MKNQDPNSTAKKNVDGLLARAQAREKKRSQGSTNLVLTPKGVVDKTTGKRVPLQDA